MSQPNANADGQGGLPDEIAVAKPSPAQAVAAAVGRDIADLLVRPLSPGLHIVATPIGNLSDITLRALATLARADAIYCEDTRHSLRLTRHFGITRHLVAYHEHNAAAIRPRILEALAAGRRLALISDAGTPLVSDPGFKLVRDVLAAGHAVWAVPGASAVLAALTVAGLPTDAFRFAGFLPPKAMARRSRLAALLDADDTTVVFEAPTRLAEALADLAALAPTRPVAVARELTKIHETVLRGPAAEIAALCGAHEIKGECVLLIGPAHAVEALDDAALIAQLRDTLTSTPLSAAVRAVATASGVPRKRVYDLALALKADTSAAHIEQDLDAGGTL